MFTCGVNRRVDRQAIAAAIDGHPALSHGCWNPARIHHAVRLLDPPEAACERTGSHMHLLWDPVQHLSPDQLVHRLVLREAGVRCIGSARDELIVKEVVQAFKCMFRYSPHVGHYWASRTGRQRGSWALRAERKRAESAVCSSGTHASYHAATAAGDAEDLELGESSGEEAGVSIIGLDTSRSFLTDVQRAARARFFPTQMDREAAATLWTHIDGATGVVRRLPMFPERADQTKKGRAESVVRESLDGWMRSKAGKAWSSEREALWAPLDERTD